jgi:phosphate transport system substrate-binding protein
MKKITQTFLAVAIALGFAQAARADITVKGSDTLVILAQKWAETYMGQKPGVKIQVTGGGTGTGFAALQNKTTDLCNASRKIKSAEIAKCIEAFGKRPTEYKVALDGLSIYVAAENAVKELTVEQLELIFTGKIKNWKEVGGNDAPITVYSRENSSGTYEFFKEHVLKGKDFAASAQTMPGTAAVLQAVAKDKNGIGYGGAAYGAGAKHLSDQKGRSFRGGRAHRRKRGQRRVSDLAASVHLREPGARQGRRGRLPELDSQRCRPEGREGSRLLPAAGELAGKIIRRTH